MNKRIVLTSLWLLLSGWLHAQNAQLIAFVNTDADVDKAFIRNTYPQIERLAFDYNLELILHDIKDGVPEELRITPQLVFQNQYGRSFYISRYSELDRLKVFFRSVRNSAKELAPNRKQNILVREEGKARVIIPLKITELRGSVLSEVNTNEFYKDAMDNFNSGFDEFDLNDINFGPTDRAYYVDLHPYISEEKQLYISYEIYSQFNCVIPVISKLNEPVTGLLKDADEIFKKLGSQVEKLVVGYIKSATNGDGFTPISTQPVVNWESIGLGLLKGEVSKRDVNVTNFEKSWKEPTPLDPLTPLVQFNFLAPLDSYAGEATTLEGSLNWQVDMLSGEFSIPTNSITMGEETYDENVHKKYIKVKRFPKATLKFDNQQVYLNEVLEEPGRTYELEGVLSFMGKDQQVSILTSFEPFVNEKGTNQLIIVSKFTTNIYTSFKVKGPDGPQRAKENMSFQAQFILSPNSKQL